MLKRILSIILAVIFAALPLAALAEGAITRDLPVTFDEHDAAMLRAFFEIEDENGIRNGEKLFAIYDPYDPTTWVGQADLFPPSGMFHDMVRWTEDGKLKSLILTERDLVGSFAADGAEECIMINVSCNRLSGISVSNCPELSDLYAYQNELTSFEIDDSNKVWWLWLSDNRLTEIDLSPLNSHLNMLMIHNNRLSELDLSGMMYLENIGCSHNELTRLSLAGSEALVLWPNVIDASYNRLTEIDFGGISRPGDLIISGNPFTSLDFIDLDDFYHLECLDCPLTYLRFKSGGNTYTLSSDGNGFVGTNFYSITGDEHRILAYPKQGYDFDAWYDGNGAWVYFDEEQDIPDDELRDLFLTAVFEPNGEPVDPPQGGSGDVNGDGAVTLSDALLALRCALSLMNLTGEHFTAADYNGNGIVDINDALLILRRAMGLI